MSYYILALSAYKDPLTGQPLKIADKDRAALNDLNLKADAPDKAYVPSQDSPQKAAALGAADSHRPRRETEPWRVSRSPGPTQAPY